MSRLRNDFRWRAWFATSLESRQAGNVSVLARPAESRWVSWAVLVGVCGVLFFYGLGIGELYRTESLRAIIGAEFLRSGNWIVPTLYGEPLLTKPPGMYAAIAAASWFHGQVTEWSARLPSAIAATMTVLLFYWYVSRHLGRLAGLVVALAVPCSFLWLDKASAAEIDMLQVFWVAAALLFSFRATEESDPELTAGVGTSTLEKASPPRRWVSFAFWLAALMCVAGGILTKWTAGVFFYTTAIPFLLWRRQWRVLWSWPHLVSLAVAIFVCLAWVAAVVDQVGWKALYDTVLAEGLPRISHTHHLGSASKQIAETLLHPLKLLAANLPWSGLALVTLWPGFKNNWDARGRRLLFAFHCWAWPNLVVWTILPDHATRHSFPLFPGIAALGAMAALALMTHRLPAGSLRWVRGYIQVSVVFSLLAAVGAVAAGFYLLPGRVWWLVLLLGGMGVLSLHESWRASKQGQWGWVFAGTIMTWLVLKLAFVHVYVPIRNHGREPREKAAVLARHVPPQRTLYVFRVKDEGIMFYYGRPVIRLREWKELPAKSGPAYCILLQSEFDEMRRQAAWQVLWHVPFHDEQGDPIVLVAVQRRTEGVLRAGADGTMIPSWNPQPPEPDAPAWPPLRSFPTPTRS